MKRTLLFLIICLAGFAGRGQILSLDSCKVMAVQNNNRLKEARFELKASEEIKKEALANYFPKVEAGAVAMKVHKGLVDLQIPETNLPVYDGNPLSLQNPTQFAYLPGMNIGLLDYTNATYATAVQPVYAGSRIRNGNKLASLGEDINRDKIELTIDQVLLTTEEYYWNLVALKQKGNALLSYEKMLNNLLNDVSVAYDAGIAQKSDVLKVQLELNKIHTNKLKLENGIALLKMTLAQHLGVVYSDSLDVVVDSIPVLAPATYYRNPDEVLARRAEYRMLTKAVDAEELKKKLAMGEYMPQLAVGVQGFYLDMMDHTATNGLAFATLSIPISDWWGGTHKIKEHNLKIEIARNSLDEKSELLKLQMNKCFNDLVENYKQIEVAELTEKQAGEHLKVLQDNYQAGIASTSDLLEAQAMHQQALDGVVEAKANYRIRLAYYLQAISALR